MVEDTELKEQYARYVEKRKCPCGWFEPVGFYLCIQKKTGRAVKLYSCQTCLDLETAWEHIRIPDPTEPTPSGAQMELMI